MDKTFFEAASFWKYRLFLQKHGSHENMEAGWELNCHGKSEPQKKASEKFPDAFKIIKCVIKYRMNYLATTMFFRNTTCFSLFIR